MTINCACHNWGHKRKKGCSRDVPTILWSKVGYPRIVIALLWWPWTVRWLFCTALISVFVFDAPIINTLAGPQRLHMGHERALFDHFGVFYSDNSRVQESWARLAHFDSMGTWPRSRCCNTARQWREVCCRVFSLLQFRGETFRICCLLVVALVHRRRLLRVFGFSVTLIIGRASG